MIFPATRTAITYLPLFLFSILIFFITATAAIPSNQIEQLSKNQRQTILDGDSIEIDEIDDDAYEEDEIDRLMARSRLDEEERKMELPGLGLDDPYTIVEETDQCFWCGTEVVEDDFEHRAATIFTSSEFIAPGTCIINQSPNWPRKYPRNVDYRWTYTTHPDSVLTFSVEKGGLQISRGCFRDKLNVRVGGTTTKKCGQFYNFNIDSEDTALMYVRFATNRRINWHGYNGSICASVPVSTTTTTTSTTSTTSTSTTTTPPVPIYCDDICGDASGYSGARISQQNDANVTYPWVITVDVMRDEVYIRCSGYLISRKHIITSAFCFFQETPTGVDDVMVRVMAGEYDISSTETPAAQVLYADNVTLYDDFDESNGGGVYNMALITMPGDGFTLNTNVAPICIANSTIESAVASPFATVTVSGFGWTENDYPAINMTSADLTMCPFTWADTDLLCIYLVGATTTPCHGDAGAAIYGRWTAGDGKYYAVGHVNAITVDDCPLNGFVIPCPATAFYYDWINDATGVRLCNND